MKPDAFLLSLALLVTSAAEEPKTSPAEPAAPAEKPAPPPETPPAPAPVEAPAAGLGAEEKVVEMEVFKVRGNPVGNFAITVQVFIRKDTGKMQLIISKVAPGTDAARLGLMPSDEIVKIGGLTVADMEPDVGKDSPLGKLLLNRKSGDILDLEVVSHRPRAVKLRAQSWSGIIPDRG